MVCDAYLEVGRLDYLGLSLEEWQQPFGREKYFHPNDRGRIDGFFLIVLSVVPLLASWRRDYANVMEVIAGSSLVLTQCETNWDRLHVSMLPGRTATIASRLRILFAAKTSLYVMRRNPRDHIR